MQQRFRQIEIRHNWSCGIKTREHAEIVWNGATKSEAEIRGSNKLSKWSKLVFRKSIQEKSKSNKREECCIFRQTRDEAKRK